MVFTQAVRFYRAPAFNHECSARHVNFVRLSVRLSVLDAHVLWQNG